MKVSNNKYEASKVPYLPGVKDCALYFLDQTENFCKVLQKCKFDGFQVTLIRV